MRLKPILDLNFSLKGLSAYVGKSRVGVVEDFTVDISSLYIAQIYVKPGLIRSFSSPRLIFSRDNVEQITPKAIYFSQDNTQIEKETGIEKLTQSAAQSATSSNSALTES